MENNLKREISVIFIVLIFSVVVSSILRVNSIHLRSIKLWAQYFNSDYFGMLILSIIFIITGVGYLYLVHKWKKNGKINHLPYLPMKPLSALSISLIGSIVFVMYVPELTDVLFHHTKNYEGECEIDIYSGRDPHLEANLGEISIRFDFDYYKVQEGTYYCKVEYYPHSEEGYSLILYETKGGKEVDRILL